MLQPPFRGGQCVETICIFLTLRLHNFWKGMIARIFEYSSLAMVFLFMSPSIIDNKIKALF